MCVCVGERGREFVKTLPPIEIFEALITEVLSSTNVIPS